MSSHGHPPIDSLLGRRFVGRYEILEKLGGGGMGEVYLARMLALGSEVAIKVLRSSLVSETPEVVERFHREAQVMARLRHPNIPRILDYGQSDDGRLFFVTEYIPGRALLDIVRQQTLGAVRTLQVMRQVASVLAEAHANGIVHRDLKPANLMIEDVQGDELVKVLDFGIAHVGDASAVTMAGSIIGTPAYMAPEQIAGGVIDGRVDLYALGAVAYECLSGRPPFEDRSPVAVMMAQVNEIPRSFRERTAPLAVHPAVESLVMELLAKAPDDRPPDAKTLLGRIDEVTEIVAPREFEGFFEEEPTEPESPHHERHTTAPVPVVIDTPLVDEVEVAPTAAVRDDGRWTRRGAVSVALLVLIASAGWALHTRAPDVAKPIEDVPAPVATPRPAAPSPPAPTVAARDAGVVQHPPKPVARPRRRTKSNARRGPKPTKRHPKIYDELPQIPGM